MKSLIVILALVGSCTLGAAELTPVQTTQMQQVVRYQSSDLATAKGLHRVYSRLNLAASLVCGNYSHAELAYSASYQRCIAESVSRAVAEIHDERLTRYHESQTSSAPRSASVAMTSSAQ